jgi:uncharacterized protein
MIAQELNAEVRESSKTAADKELELRSLMRAYARVLVAYSGGVDSAYLALIANQELGTGAFAVMGISPSVSSFQRSEAAEVASKAGLNFHTLETGELEIESYTANPTNRCFFCKSELYEKLAQFASVRAIEQIFDGANADDLLDDRPGRVAASEKGVISPLAEVGMTKAEIRERSRHHGLATWDKPASPCLSSRIAYGVPVTIERLSKIERAEDYLRLQGFTEFRVREHGDIARIEIARGEMEKILDLEFTGRVAEVFRGFGFKYVTLDLQGFRSGAMNEALKASS